MDNYKKYRMYGLSLLSEIELNCYEGLFEQQDITIRRISADVIIDNDLYSIEGKLENEFISYRVDETVTYYVFSGKEIHVLANEDADDSKIELFLLGAVFALLFLQRNIFALHGSAIELNGKAIILIGESGAGKSSLASGFFARGSKIISDDVSRIQLDSEKPFVYPSYPSQKIWENTASALDIDLVGASRIHNRYEKFSIKNKEGFYNEEVQVEAVFEIFPNSLEDVHIKEVDKSSSLSIFLNNTYAYEFIQRLKYRRQEHLKFAADISNKLPIYRIYRPEGKFTVDEQINEIIKMISK